MQYEWDEKKRLANLARHKVDFNDAIEFQWDTAIETIRIISLRKARKRERLYYETQFYKN